MKVRIVDPITVALAKLNRSVDPATGARRVYQSIDALKASCPIEDVVAQCLEQEPDNPGSNRLKFYCFEHERDGAEGGHTPSLYVNVEQQRWGCEAGCFEGRSGNVIDFVQKVNGWDFKSALDWLRVWSVHHGQRSGRIRIRLPAKRKRRR